MKRCLFRYRIAIVVTAFVCTTCFVARLEAGIIPLHAKTRVYGTNRGNGIGFDKTISGEFAADTGSHSHGYAHSEYGWEWSGSARASVGGNGTYSSFLRLEAHAETVNGGNGVGSISLATAQWEDIVFLNGPSNLRGIQLIFEATAHFSSEDGGYNFGGSSDLATGYIAFEKDTVPDARGRDFFTTTSVVANGQLSWPDAWGIREENADGVSSLNQGFLEQNPLSPNGNFTGSFIIDSDFDSETGGFRFAVQALVEANATRTAMSHVDFGSSLSLVAVTDQDGNVIDPSLLSFDSGLRLQNTSPVPEPSSILLVVLASVCLFGTNVVRRRKTHAAAVT